MDDDAEFMAAEEVLALVKEAEAVLSDLSDALQEMPADRNQQWADAAVDRALRDLDRVRAWLAG